MPWVDKVQGVVEAWYAGSSGHKALANVLDGQVKPTGKLAMTFAESEKDLAHPTIPPLAGDPRVGAAMSVAALVKLERIHDNSALKSRVQGVDFLRKSTL